MTADPPDEQPSGGRLQPTSPGAVTAWAVAGLVGGWLWHPVSQRLLGAAPIVGWLQPAALFVVAAILGGTAWLTWRAVHVRRERLDPQQAVNRLVLARTCVLVGALVAGGYLGFALSWLGDGAELAGQRAGRSVVAGVAGVAITVTAVLLERACRVRSNPDES